MKLAAAASRLGMDYSAVLERFSGNESLLEKFVRKFPADRSYAELCAAIESGDAQGVTFHAHALKGLAGNLGFSALYKCAANLNNAGKENKTEQFPELFKQIEAEYKKVIQGIGLLD